MELNSSSSTTIKYTSVFRLDGIPILPPLMTVEKRRQMQQLRGKAINIEQKRKEKLEAVHQFENRTFELKANQKDNHKDELAYEAACKAMQDSYNILSKLVLNSEMNNMDQKLQQLQRSETVIYDNTTNSVIVPIPIQDEKDTKEEGEANNNYQRRIPAINIHPPTPLTGTRTLCNILDNSDDSIESIETKFSEFSIDTVSCSTVNTTEIDVQELSRIEADGPKRSATSPSLNDISAQERNYNHLRTNESNERQPLLRSNSFTIESPSKALLEHMRQQQEQKQQTTSKPFIGRDTVESRAKQVSKVDMRTTKTPANAGTRIARSPYEQRLAVKPKLARNLKKSVSTTNNNKRPSSTPTPTSKSLPTRLGHLQRKLDANKYNVNSDASHNMQMDQREKYLQLLGEQQEEQKRLEQAFQLQRSQFLREMSLNEHTDNNDRVRLIPTSKAFLHTFNNNPTSTPMQNTCKQAGFAMGAINVSSPLKDNYFCPRESTNVLKEENARQTPRRRLFMHEGSNPCQFKFLNKPHDFEIEERKRNKVINIAKIQYMAATKINAHVRGYLVRRLYQTEQVQRIVQTIKETLLFVLSLYKEEPVYDDIELNIQNNKELKIRLLQQLLSATKAFHIIFFESTIKERMEVIARDRQLIKTNTLRRSLN